MAPTLPGAENAERSAPGLDGALLVAGFLLFEKGVELCVVREGAAGGAVVRFAEVVLQALEFLQALRRFVRIQQRRQKLEGVTKALTSQSQRVEALGAGAASGAAAGAEEVFQQPARRPDWPCGDRGDLEGGHGFGQRGRVFFPLALDLGLNRAVAGQA